MPRGLGVWASAVLTETGTLGLTIALLLQSHWVRVFALLAFAGVAAFFVQVTWMIRHRRTPAKGLRHPDFGVLQVGLALAYLMAGTALGVFLAFSKTTGQSLRLVLVYGVCLLVGFLSQIVVGVSARLLPLMAWFGAFAAKGMKESPPSPHAYPDRRLQALTLVLWTPSVPLLAAGFYVERAGLLRLGAGLLLAAVLVGAWSHIAILRSASATQDRTHRSAC